MPSCQKVLFTAALTMLAFFALHQSADAYDFTWQMPIENSYIDTSVPLTVGATVTQSEDGSVKFSPYLNMEAPEARFCPLAASR